MVNLASANNIFRLKGNLQSPKEDDYLEKKLEEITNLENELYTEIDEVDLLLRQKKKSRVLKKVLTVKRNEIIRSLKKMKKPFQAQNSSNKKNTPLNKTPKRCDFIATTESIKNLKSNPRNSSP